MILKNIAILSKFIKSKVTHKPFLLSHMITSACNANCEFYYWKEHFINELTYENIVNLYKEAKKYGFKILVIWGGEPLLRKDICEILKIAKKNDFYIQLITNGFLLPQKAKDISRYLDSLVVSVDNIGEKHDEIRKLNGCFSNLDKGTDIFNKHKRKTAKLYFNCCLTKNNQPNIKNLLNFARRKKAGITFDEIIVNESTKRLQLKSEDLSVIFREILQYKSEGYPVVNSNLHLQQLINKKELPKCIYHNICLTVGPSGDINTVCRPYVDNNWNTKNRGLDFLSTKEYRDYQHKTYKCPFKCNDVASREFYFLWNFKLESIFNLIRCA